VGELPDHLREHWTRLREQLLAGMYQPAQVKQQLIPKASGGMRKLGIPTVVDRFIQQALLQVLQPMFDPDFSSTATASGLDTAPTTPSSRRRGTSRTGASGSWTWTWSNSSTA